MIMSKKLLTLSKTGSISIEQSTVNSKAECGSAAVKFVCIVGPARTGKSYLLNCLTGRVGDFSVGNEDTVTKGVDICMHPVTLNDDQSTRYYLLDVEGMGDNSDDDDYQLCLPVVASVDLILFNVRGQVGRNDLLNLLGRFVFMHRKVFTANSTSATADDSLQSKPKLFPHLLLVMRDWTFNEDFQAKYLDKLLLPEEDEANPSDEKVKKRNELKKTLKECFQSIDILVLPLPAEQKDIQGAPELPFGKLTEQFNGKISDLKHLVESKAGNKTQSTIFGNRCGTMDAFVKTLGLLVGAVNESDFQLPSVLDALKTYYVSQLESAMKLWIQNNCPLPELPVHPDSLATNLDNRLNAIKTEYAKKAKGMDLDASHCESFLAPFKKDHEAQAISNDGRISDICKDACSAFVRHQLNNTKTVGPPWTQAFGNTLRMILSARGVVLSVAEVSGNCRNTHLQCIAQCFNQVVEQESRARKEEEKRTEIEREAERKIAEERDRARRALEEAERERARRALEEAERQRQAAQFTSASYYSPPMQFSYQSQSQPSSLRPSASRSSVSSSGDMATGTFSPTGRAIYQGPRGGQYHISSGGNKVYHKR